MSETDKTTINIVTACDNAYVQHTAVFLRSLIEKNSNIRVFILIPQDFAHRRSLVRNLGSRRVHIEFLQIDVPDIAAFKILHDLTVTTYFRLFMDKLLPQDIKRVIYLDSDILITKTLDELWGTSLEDNAVGAVIDTYLDVDMSVREKIGLAPTSHYFNAGVLLIDLDRWRRQKMGERAIAFAIEHPELLTYEDQCAINYVLSGKCKELNKEWNFQTHHLRWTERGICTADALRELKAAKIVHFTGQLKPWHYLADHPMKSLYWKFLRLTEWRGYCPPDRTKRNILRRTVEDFKKSLEVRVPALMSAARRLRKLSQAARANAFGNFR